MARLVPTAGRPVIWTLPVVDGADHADASLRAAFPPSIGGFSQQTAVRQ